MKTLIAIASLLALAIIAMAGIANADMLDSHTNPTALFSNQKATGTTAIYSNPGHFGQNTKATALFSLYSSGAVTTSGLINGTTSLQCGATSTGPWVGMKDKLGNAVTPTANSIYELDSLCLWVRAAWTPTAISTNRALSVYLLTGNVSPFAP